MRNGVLCHDSSASGQGPNARLHGRHDEVLDGVDELRVTLGVAVVPTRISTPIRMHLQIGMRILYAHAF